MGKPDYQINVGQAAGSDHPAGMVWLYCTGCRGSWVGWPDATCEWCDARDARMRDDERKALLFPSWAARNGPRYDDLSDADKAVWRQTRGQHDDADSIIRWMHNLTVAVEDGVISEDEA